MIKCKICGKDYQQITTSHLKRHDMTMESYREQFPDAVLTTQEVRDSVSNALVGKPKSPEHVKK